MSNQLPPEINVQGNDSEYPADDSKRKWTRGIQSTPLLKIANLTSWVVVTMENQHPETYNFVKQIIKTAGDIGFSMPPPRIVISWRRNSNYADTLELMISHFNPAFIMCVLDHKESDPKGYNAIKKKCTVELPVPTQVVWARNMTRNDAMSIATKLAVQINCKLGGAPFQNAIPIKGLMVVGYDVRVDSYLKESNFCAFIATLDDQMTQYFSTVNTYTSGLTQYEQLGSHMSSNITNALKRYKEVNGSLPSYILFYRGHVHERQIPNVVAHELANIKKRLTELYVDNEPPKMAFIAVSFKRRNELTRPDIVVDKVIKPQRYYFYLEWEIREGLVASTSYMVLEDTTELGPDSIQDLSNKLTKNYFNHMDHTNVQVPSVCQWARKLVVLVARTLHTPPHNAMSDKLHFI